MKPNHEYTLGNAIKEVVSRLRMNQKLEEVNLMASWEPVVGSMIAHHTDHLAIKNGILYVNLDSAPLRSELMMARSKIVKALNKEAGKNLIKDIVFR
ncbi:MAG: DUF721 domain-containing protein [Bacteroidetes bacterium]|nr:MAG: DUF721 domain-containing protein [Bacteroidota bacterium]